MITSREHQLELGLLEWFHLNDKKHVETAIQQVQELGITKLRTGISWADYHTPDGEKWLEWMIPILAEHVDILPCLLYTPPSIGISEKTSAPPRNPIDFAVFTSGILQKFGDYFEWVELWNEPNNPSEYDFRLDPGWDVFCEMIGQAAKEVKKYDKKVLLGGMSPVDPGWLDFMYEKGLMKDIDAVGIHGFPDTFDFDWPGWKAVVQQATEVIDNNEGDQDVWISEAGYSTWQNDENEQIKQLLDVMKAPVDRIYWYCLNDLDPERPTIDGFHADDREYYFGMVNNVGTPKLLYRILKNYGLNRLDEFDWITKPYISIPDKRKSILITGGAGFIGTNLADRFLREGNPVTIFDNLKRPGVETNLEWLRDTHRGNLNIKIADVRNKYEVEDAVDAADFVYHFAAQVAVTTSYRQPVRDFQTNAGGTLNVLEAIRNSSHQPPIIFTSTNKVYGTLDGLDIIPNAQQYKLKERTLDENQKLDFHSPYGCSKGSADAYVRDYARLYDLKTAVFRMSCIYGPHQLGTEDQGWLAHFLIQALNDEPITIFGDGKQVRDVLYVEDLIDAFQLAYEQIDKLSGEAFNIGGGPDNSTSLIEFIRLLKDMTGKQLPCHFEEWRPGDQKYFVSDTRKFSSITGWKPDYSISEGVNELYRWLLTTDLVKPLKPAVTA